MVPDFRCLSHLRCVHIILLTLDNIKITDQSVSYLYIIPKQSSNHEPNHHTKTATLAGKKSGIKRICKRSVKSLTKKPIHCRGFNGFVVGVFWGESLRMSQSSLLLDIEIAYYKTMSKIAQYERNYLKNRIKAAPVKVLQNEVYV